MSVLLFLEDHFASTGSAACIAPGETLPRTEERVWHILCLSRFSAQGKKAASCVKPENIPRTDIPTSLIAVVCWETLVDCY